MHSGVCFSVRLSWIRQRIRTIQCYDWRSLALPTPYSSMASAVAGRLLINFFTNRRAALAVDTIQSCPASTKALQTKARQSHVKTPPWVFSGIYARIDLNRCNRRSKRNLKHVMITRYILRGCRCACFRFLNCIWSGWSQPWPLTFRPHNILRFASLKFQEGEKSPEIL